VEEGGPQQPEWGFLTDRPFNRFTKLPAANAPDLSALSALGVLIIISDCVITATIHPDGSDAIGKRIEAAYSSPRNAYANEQIDWTCR
jgi:hypothetical protein